MVTKSKKEDAGKKKKIKVLNLNKETVKDLTDEEAKDLKGALVVRSQASFGQSVTFGWVPPNQSRSLVIVSSNQCP